MSHELSCTCHMCELSKYDEFSILEHIKKDPKIGERMKCRLTPDCICNDCIISGRARPPKIGEIMKMRKVEIEIPPGNWKLSDHNHFAALTASVPVEELEGFHNKPGNQRSITISFDIPIPERKVEITEMQFRDAYNKALASGSASVDDFIEMLFGSDEK